MRYKVGDKVLIKSFDWYNENKNKFGKVWTLGGFIPFDKCMSVWCGKVMTISCIDADCYTMVEDLEGYWTDEMIEGLAEEETKPNTIEEAKTYWDSIKDAWICPEGYQFVDENGNVINAKKIVLEMKKKEYPKTYGECCEILGVDPHNFLTITNCYEGEVETTDYERSLSSKFTSLWGLLICRDAYWKIAGEEMGLGKPWEYDCNSEDFTPAIIYRSGCIQKVEIQYRNAILTFPTDEMRDAFYENFKELVEICKELL